MSNQRFADYHRQQDKGDLKHLLVFVPVLSSQFLAASTAARLVVSLC